MNAEGEYTPSRQTPGEDLNPGPTITELKTAPPISPDVQNLLKNKQTNKKCKMKVIIILFF